MSYVGNTNTTQAFTPAIDYFSGNGSTTAFTLSRPVASVAQVQVVVNNVAQNPSSAYTVSSNTITFTSAPSSGTNNIYVYYTSPITQVIAPGQGTVNTTSLGTITNIASGSSSLTLQTGASNTTAMTIDTSQNVGIGTSSPDYKLTIQNGDAAITLKDAGGTTRAYIGVAGVIGTAPTGALRLRSDQGGFVYGYQGTEQMRIDSSGNLLFNSGYGSVATAYGCRAWVNFNGTGTVAIRSSGNVTSITDNGVGDYTVNFTNALSDANYCVSTGYRNNISNYTRMGGLTIKYNVTPTTSALRVETGYGDDNSAAYNNQDYDYCCLSIFR